MTWLCFVPFPVTPHTGRVMIEVESAPGATTVLVRGELDLVTMPFLAEQLTLVSRLKPGRLVFDRRGPNAASWRSSRPKWCIARSG